jgi:hypothetical protein
LSPVKPTLSWNPFSRESFRDAGSDTPCRTARAFENWPVGATFEEKRIESQTFPAVTGAGPEKMADGQNPLADRLGAYLGGRNSAGLLSVVMGLSLVDGIFPAVVLAGALDSPVGILEVGLLVFGGSATLSVVLFELEGTSRQRAQTVLAVGLLLGVVAALEAAVAPTVAHLIELEVFARFSGVVLLAVAGRIASARVGDVLPAPSAIIALGLLASANPTAVRTAQLDPSLDLALRGMAAALVGTGFALAGVLFRSQLLSTFHMDRFRFASAIALGMLGAEVMGLVTSPAPLPLLVGVIGGVLAYDPGDERARTASEPRRSEE